MRPGITKEIIPLLSLCFGKYLKPFAHFFFDGQDRIPGIVIPEIKDRLAGKLGKHLGLKGIEFPGIKPKFSNVAAGAAIC